MIKSLRKRTLLLAAGALALSGCSMFSSTDPRFEPAPLTEYAPGATVSVSWSHSLGAGTHGFAPKVVGGHVYAASTRGSVIKVNVASGQQAWRVETGTTLSAGVGADGRTVAVAASDGHVIALDDQGSERWRVRATSGVNMPPVVGDGVVVVRSTDYRLQAFDEQTGELRWSLQRPGPALALRTYMRMIIVDGMLIVGMPNGRLMAVGLADGSVQWEGLVSTPRGGTDLERISDVVGEPVAVGPALCGASYQGRIVCFDVSRGGVPVWDHSFSTAGGIVSDGRRVFGATQQDIVHAYALENGEQAWRQDALRYRRLTAPAAINGLVAVGDFQGYVHFLSAADGTLMGRLQLGGDAIVSPPIPTDHGVVVHTGNGNLTLVSAR